MLLVLAVVGGVTWYFQTQRQSQDAEGGVGASQLPPTRYGYVPQPGAVATRWICANSDCSNGCGPEDPRPWPERCPNCGRAIATARLHEPWQHEAKRVEIDARLSKPLYEGDAIGAQAEDLVWRFTDALRSGRSEDAEGYRQQLDAFAKNHEQTYPYFDGGMHRWDIVKVALEERLVDMAMSEFENWLANANLEDLEEDNTRRTNCRELASCLIAFLEEPGTAALPQAGRVWAMLKELMPKIHSVATADHTTAFARLKRAKAGGNVQEESIIAELTRLREADERGATEDGLPVQTLFRMEAYGRHFQAGADSGIDTSLIWDVCLRPFLHHAINQFETLATKIAGVVLPAGGYAVVGGARCLQELSSVQSVLDSPVSLTILDSSLGYRRSIGVTPLHLAPYEWNRRLATHGVGTW